MTMCHAFEQSLLGQGWDAVVAWGHADDAEARRRRALLDDLPVSIRKARRHLLLDDLPTSVRRTLAQRQALEDLPGSQRHRAGADGSARPLEENDVRLRSTRRRMAPTAHTTAPTTTTTASSSSSPVLDGPLQDLLDDLGRGDAATVSSSTSRVVDPLDGPLQGMLDELERGEAHDDGRGGIKNISKSLKAEARRRLRVQRTTDGATDGATDGHDRWQHTSDGATDGTTDGNAETYYRRRDRRHYRRQRSTYYRRHDRRQRSTATSTTGPHQWPGWPRISSRRCFVKRGASYAGRDEGIVMMKSHPMQLRDNQIAHRAPKHGQLTTMTISPGQTTRKERTTCQETMTCQEMTCQETMMGQETTINPMTTEPKLMPGPRTTTTK